jgi:hypothetical protein
LVLEERLAFMTVGREPTLEAVQVMILYLAPLHLPVAVGEELITLLLELGLMAVLVVVDQMETTQLRVEQVTLRL